MKKTLDRRKQLVAIGILFAWLALWCMVAMLYEGLVEAIIVAVRGGTYYRQFIATRPVLLGIWFICVTISSLCLADGLLAEKKEE